MAQSLLRFRIAGAALFFVNGCLFATWVSRIPGVKHTLGLSESELGLALLALAIGALCAFPFSGWLIARRGSGLVSVAAGLAGCALLPLAGWAPDLPLLAISLALFGACLGTMDVAMNSQAVEIEKRYGRSIMASFHGLWSLGGLIGAAGGGLLAGADWSPLLHFLFVGAVLAGFTLAARPRLLPDSPEQAAGPVFALPTRATLGLGVLAFCGAMVEGGVADWSGVYLREALGTGPGFAAAGFAAFSLAMTAGRLTGDRVIDRFGSVVPLRVGALLAAGALAVGLLSAQPFATVVGYACAGIGLSVVFPLVFGAAGRLKLDSQRTALVAVATMGYGGGLAGPPIIGFAASTTSLGFALGILVALCIVISWLASHADRKALDDEDRIGCGGDVAVETR
jgi:MFS family permease